MALVDHHLRLLARFRRSMNLVGPGPLEPHVVDCREALAVLGPLEGLEGDWVDLGSGAGFPGLVLANDAPVAVDLVESRAKRCVFLEQVIGEAAAAGERVRARVLRQRVESVGGPYDGVVSRAFAPPPVVLGHGARLLRPGGRLVLFLQEEAVVPESDVFSVEAVRSYVVPGERTLRRKSVLLRKV